MTKRESRPSDIDIRKLMPDLKTILKHADPEYSERIHREAMDNPELDAAIAARDKALAELEAQEDARRGTEEAEKGEDPLGVEGTRRVREAAAPPRVSAPSLRGKGGVEDAIDPAVLPSANAQRTEAADGGAHATPEDPNADPARGRTASRRPLPRWIAPGILVLALSPLAMWAAVSRIPSKQATENRAHAAEPASSSAATSATATAGVATPPQRHDTEPKASAEPAPMKPAEDAGASAPRPRPSAGPVHRPLIRPPATANPVAPDILP